MNILIVDDHATNRKLLRAQLEAERMSVVEAADGVEALQILAREPIDAIISDILMPRMDGYRLCHEVRKSPTLRHIRLLLYSSTYTSPADVKLSETVGADQFIAKPAPAEAILGALQVAAGLAAARPLQAPNETYVLQEYSAALVNKLEEKNAELQASLSALQRAHNRILELNSSLEHRVTERTRQLEQSNGELKAALAEVKQLSALLPICSYCKSVRDGQDYWQSVEEYVERHTASRFSHSVCPACYEKHVVPMLAAFESAPIPPLT